MANGLQMPDRVRALLRAAKPRVDAAERNVAREEGGGAVVVVIDRGWARAHPDLVGSLSHDRPGPVVFTAQLEYLRGELWAQQPMLLAPIAEVDDRPGMVAVIALPAEGAPFLTWRPMSEAGLADDVVRRLVDRSLLALRAQSWDLRKAGRDTHVLVLVQAEHYACGSAPAILGPHSGAEPFVAVLPVSQTRKLLLAQEAAVQEDHAADPVMRAQLLTLITKRPRGCKVVVLYHLPCAHCACNPGIAALDLRLEPLPSPAAA